MTAFVRETKETAVRLEVARGAGRASVTTGVPFLDHMLLTLARYARLDLTLQAGGDLRHHVVEDTALALGEALAKEAGAVARFGERTIPMDDALVQVALDLGGRPYYAGPLPSTLYDHWLRSFATAAGATLHVRVLRGRDRHHVVEAAFKALGFALRDALVPAAEVTSTKGAVRRGEGAC